MGKNGTVRSDNLRSHVRYRHSEGFTDTFVDAGGWGIKVLSPKLIMKTKSGRLGHGYCFECFSYIDVAGQKQSAIESYVRSHTCRPRQVREKRAKIVGGKVVPPEKRMSTDFVLKALKEAGLNDAVELTDDLEVDIKKTLANVKACAAPHNPDSMLEKAKKDKTLAALKIGEREQQRRDAITELNMDGDWSDEEEEEPEVFDDWEDVFRPLLMELSKTVPQREKLSNTIKDLRTELEKWEDKYDMMVSEKDREIYTLRQRLIEAYQPRGEPAPPQERIQPPTEDHESEEEEPDEEEADTIQHVGENNYQQWSLPYRG
jgi:hypothetical protein